MVFAPECGHVPVAKSSGGADQKAGSASRRSHQFVSLRNRDDFERVYRRGHRVRFHGLTVVTLKGPSTLPRVGIVAGKKVGNAVSRNRAKRRLREAASRAVLQNHTDYILIAQPTDSEVAFTDLVDAISGGTSRD